MGTDDKLFRKDTPGVLTRAPAKFTYSYVHKRPVAAFANASAPDEWSYTPGDRVTPGVRHALYDGLAHYREAPFVTDRNLIITVENRFSGAVPGPPDGSDAFAAVDSHTADHAVTPREEATFLDLGERPACSSSGGCTNHLHGRGRIGKNVSSCSVGNVLTTDSALARSCDDERAE